MNNHHSITNKGGDLGSPKLNFLRSFQGHHPPPAPKTPITARMHHLPIVPLSKPSVICTRTTQAVIGSKEGYNDNRHVQSSGSDKECMVGAFTMSHSWPITCPSSKPKTRGEY